MASLSEVVSYTDRFLRIRDAGDWDNALNGVQIENSGRVTRCTSVETIQDAMGIYRSPDGVVSETVGERLPW